MHQLTASEHAAIPLVKPQRDYFDELFACKTELLIMKPTFNGMRTRLLTISRILAASKDATAQTAREMIDRLLESTEIISHA